jgi:tRNA (guanine37-N1)-methyltransferase
MFPSLLGQALSGKAKGTAWDLTAHNIRDFSLDKHKSVDDTPYGGGAGMVLKADVLARAIDAVSPQQDTRKRLLMSPRGAPLTQAKVREFAAQDGLVIICGRFEGVDERVIAARNLEEISIGDYILSGGEVAALVLLDSIIRLLPDVMGKIASGLDESFENGLLEYPHYTRPALFEGLDVPKVLSSGNHGEIEKWRRAQSLELTRARRPDLLR